MRKPFPRGTPRVAPLAIRAYGHGNVRHHARLRHPRHVLSEPRCLDFGRPTPLELNTMAAV
eukprot:359724-Chlamydomonas_euryale.AAC.3